MAVSQKVKFTVNLQYTNDENSERSHYDRHFYFADVKQVQLDFTNKSYSLGLLDKLLKSVRVSSRNWW